MPIGWHSMGIYADQPHRPARFIVELDSLQTDA